MAAAHLTMSGAKGSFMILTLLCLVHFSNSLINKDQLEELKKNVQKLQQETMRRKAENILDRTYIPAVFDDIGHLMDPLSKLMKSVNVSTPLLTPVLNLMNDLKTFLEASKTYINKYFETTSAEIKNNEEKLSSVMAMLTQLEKHNDEL